MCKGRIELDSISPAELDQYLARGWFRTQQNMFTMRYLHRNGHFYETVWLRHRLRDLRLPKRFRRMLRKLNYRIEYSTGKPNEDHKVLYKKFQFWYRHLPKELDDLLYEYNKDIFNCHIVSVYREDGLLVGAGFFDIGESSAAGIFNYYLPIYYKQGLGMFVYYLQLQYCKDLGLDYFYPGFAAPGFAGEDYKTKIDLASLEGYDPINDTWIPFHRPDPSRSAVARMKNTLNALVKPLRKKGLDANFIQNTEYENNASPLDLPFAVYINPLPGKEQQWAITFDPDTNLYRIYDTTSANCVEALVDIEVIILCMKPLELETPLVTCQNSKEVVKAITALVFE